MSFPGYGVTLFDVRKDPVNLNEIPELFTIEYFAKEMKKRWKKSSLYIKESKSSGFWMIPELFSGDDDNPAFSGYITNADKGIYFGLALYPAITEFVLWTRSIVPFEYPVYFMKISDLSLCHELTSDITEVDILKFLQS